MSTHFIINGKNKAHKWDKRNVVMAASRCIGPCPVPVITPEGKIKFLWNDVKTWKEFRSEGIPKHGEDFHIPSTHHLVFNLQDS